jgi:hypothetical protein
MPGYVVKIGDEQVALDDDDLDSPKRAAERAVKRQFADAATYPPETGVDVFQDGRYLGSFIVTATRSREYDRGRVEAPIDVWDFIASPA